MDNKIVNMNFLKLDHGFSVESQHERAVAMARDAFAVAAEQKQQLLPIFMPYIETGFEDMEGPVIGLFPTPWEDPDDKQVWLGCIRGLFAKIKPIRYSFWAEVWLASYTPEQAKGEIVEPRNREDRLEFLFITTVQKDGPPMVTSLRIERDWETEAVELVNDPILDDVDTLDGQLLTLLP